jgi:mRNA-degrading endonuclease RelE of RelBE toxin-antitoxin system
MVERITSYQFTKKFKKEYRTLPKEIQDNFHSSLRVKRNPESFGSAEFSLCIALTPI